MQQFGKTIIYDEQVVFNGGVTCGILPVVNLTKIPKLLAIPLVENINFLVCINTVATTITNFKKGAEGQTLRLLGEGQTSVANNANIKTNTGALKLLAANIIYTFTMYLNVWYENE